MQNLIPYRNTLWLCEPNRLQQLAGSAAAIAACYNKRQIAKARAAERKPLANLDTMIRGEGHGVDDSREKAEGNRADAPRAIRAVKGKVGVIDIQGPVDQFMSSALIKAGGTSLDFVNAAFDAMMANPGISAIVLHVDSPGGGTYGTQELSDKIFNARADKPSYCMVDSMACSAAFWIGSAAGMMICTPGGDVGSVGVYAMHIDQSAAMEAEGVKVTMVSAGKYKTEMAPYAPLSADALAAMQQSVDVTYGKFQDALKRNRGASTDAVRNTYGQGRVVNADDALAAGMIDRIMTMDDLMARLTGSPQAASQMQRAQAQAPAPSQTALRMRHMLAIAEDD